MRVNVSIRGWRQPRAVLMGAGPRSAVKRSARPVGTGSPARSDATHRSIISAVLAAAFPDGGFVTEHAFHGERKWRFDHASKKYMIAVEVEGGVFRGGHHSRGKGFVDDCEKYNAAAILGWRVLRYPAHLVDSLKGATRVAHDIREMVLRLPIANAS